MSFNYEKTNMVARGKHSLGVLQQCIRFSEGLSVEEKANLYAAAINHDIGYQRQYEGYHSVMGSAMAKEMGFNPIVGDLILLHDLADVLFPEEDYFRESIEKRKQMSSDFEKLLNILIHSDCTTNVHGELVTLDERIEDVGRRYGVESLSYRNIKILEPVLREIGAKVANSISV